MSVAIVPCVPMDETPPSAPPTGLVQVPFQPYTSKGDAIAAALRANGIRIERKCWVRSLGGHVWRPVEHDSIFRALSNPENNWRVRILVP